MPGPIRSSSLIRAKFITALVLAGLGVTGVVCKNSIENSREKLLNEFSKTTKIETIYKMVSDTACVTDLFGQTKQVIAPKRIVDKDATKISINVADFAKLQYSY